MPSRPTGSQQPGMVALECVGAWRRPNEDIQSSQPTRGEDNAGCWVAYNTAAAAQLLRITLQGPTKLHTVDVASQRPSLMVQIHGPHSCTRMSLTRSRRRRP